MTETDNLKSADQTAQTASLEPTWATGAGRALPVVLGYIPVGFAFGVLAQKSGLSPLNTVLMSILVYAGASQFIAVGLLAAGAPPLSIILTTFIVNLRHLIMASALAPYLKTWSPGALALFSYELTDETFALHATYLPRGETGRGAVLATNLVSQSSWVAGTWLGVTAGSLIADVKPYALDYALAALFIALLMLQIKNKKQVMVAMAAGVLSVILLHVGFNQWSIILATLVGATLGVFLEKWIRN